MPPRYAPANPLPPYAYVPGHDLPHPVTDSCGHSFSVQAELPGALNPSPVLASIPTDPASHRRVLAATLAATTQTALPPETTLPPLLAASVLH